MGTPRRLRTTLDALPTVLGGSGHQLVEIVGTDGTTTWWWAGAEDLSARSVVDEARRVAAALARPWWRICEDPL